MGRMSGGPVGAVSPLLEAKLSVSGRVDIDTTGVVVAHVT